MKNSEIQKCNQIACSFLLAYFSTWMLMNLHFMPEHVAQYESMMQAFLEGRGHAPDQFRILQIYLIGIPYIWLDLYSSIWVFSLISLFFMNMAIFRSSFIGLSGNAKFVITLALAASYPIAMYTGPRWDTGFIIALALMLIEFERRNSVAWFFSFLALLSLARADIALCYALILVIWDRSFFSWRRAFAALAIPLAIQGIMKFAIFSGAQYSVETVMIKENLNIQRFNMAPMIFLIAACVIYWRSCITDFLGWLFRHGFRGQGVLIVFFLYIASLFIVAIFSEIRLFLPLIPLFALLASDYRKDITPSAPPGKR